MSSSDPRTTPHQGEITLPDSVGSPLNLFIGSVLQPFVNWGGPIASALVLVGVGAFLFYAARGLSTHPIMFAFVATVLGIFIAFTVVALRREIRKRPGPKA